MSEIAHTQTLAYFRSINTKIDSSTDEYITVYFETLSTIIAAQSTTNNFTSVGYPSPHHKTELYKRYGVHNSPIVDKLAYYNPIQHCWMSRSSNAKLSRYVIDCVHYELRKMRDYIDYQESTTLEFSLWIISGYHTLTQYNLRNVLTSKELYLRAHISPRNSQASLSLINLTQNLRN
jgi:hypothetical protein